VHVTQDNADISAELCKILVHVAQFAGPHNFGENWGPGIFRGFSDATHSQNMYEILQKTPKKRAL
jgi:hypothetical protein